MGGPVEAGGTYLVGEHRPELLTLGSQGGYISPNTGAYLQSRPSLSAPGRVPGGQGGGSVVYHNETTINATTGATAAEIAHEVGWTLLTLPTVPHRNN